MTKYPDKPNWFPKNPYPKDIFPMHESEYARIVPDPKTRTALSGCLGRGFYNAAVDDIWETICDLVDEGLITISEELKND
jgi:hypothetical protein